jgi:hypothetical protein
MLVGAMEFSVEVRCKDSDGMQKMKWGYMNAVSELLGL